MPDKNVKKNLQLNFETFTIEINPNDLNNVSAQVSTFTVKETPTYQGNSWPITCHKNTNALKKS